MIIWTFQFAKGGLRCSIHLVSGQVQPSICHAAAIVAINRNRLQLNNLMGQLIAHVVQ